MLSKLKCHAKMPMSEWEEYCFVCTLHEKDPAQLLLGNWSVGKGELIIVIIIFVSVPGNPVAGKNPERIVQNKKRKDLLVGGIDKGRGGIVLHGNQLS